MSLSDKYSFPKPTENLLEHLLSSRLTDIAEKEYFLRPDWSSNHDPFLMHNMQAVVDRVWQAIKENQHIVVYADYDADGVPGAVVLTNLLRKLNHINYSIHIPDRNLDGFGLNKRLCDQIISESSDRAEPTLLITIDCGISNTELIDYLQKNQIEVIVTDHHLPDMVDREVKLPNCLILDPKQPSCTYPCDVLCGTGVIFKLVQAMLTQQPDGYNIDPEWSKWLLDMVGIATVCDMVPLTDENRLFAYYGLKVLAKTKRPGLRTLIQLAGIDQYRITETDLGFGIGPRINAASRLSSAMIAYTALSEAEPIAANKAATEMDSLNKRRKILTASAAKYAYKKADEQTRDGAKLLVIGNPDWQLGIVGLVAGLVAQKYNLPTFIWTRITDTDGNTKYKGSARSGAGCSIHCLMSAAQTGQLAKVADPNQPPKKPTSRPFISFGGHDAAGGFVCSESQIHYLAERLAPHVDYCTYDTAETKLPIDGTLELEHINKDLWDTLCLLKPYGVGNMEPTFILQNLVIDRIRLFGSDEQHLSLYFRDSRFTSHEAIRFSYTDILDSAPQVGDQITLICTIEQNTFNGASNLRMKILDIEVNK